MFKAHLEALLYDESDKQLQVTERRLVGTIAGRDVVFAVWKEGWELANVLIEHSNWKGLIDRYTAAHTEAAAQHAAGPGALRARWHQTRH